MQIPSRFNQNNVSLGIVHMSKPNKGPSSCIVTVVGEPFGKIIFATVQRHVPIPVPIDIFCQIPNEASLWCARLLCLGMCYALSFVNLSVAY